MITCEYSITNIEVVKELINNGAEINFDHITKFNNKEVNEILIERYKYDPYIIRNIVTKEKFKKLIMDKSSKENINESIIKHKNVIYDYPGNIRSLCAEIKFNIKIRGEHTYNNISNKLKFLFDIKNKEDMINKINDID